MKRTVSTTTIVAPARKKAKTERKSSLKNWISNPVKNGFADKLRTTCTYVGTRTITLASAGLYSTVFSANGLYDPDITGSGHQPRGFDQLMAAYRTFTVIGSRCTVMPLHLSTTTVTPGLYCILLSRDGAAKAGANDYEVLEQKFVSDYKVISSPAEENHKVRLSFNAKKFFGGNAEDERDLQGDVSANPPEQAFFHVCWGQQQYQAGNIQFVVKIEYDVVFSTPVELATS